jgi:hypothetical protein
MSASLRRFLVCFLSVLFAGVLSAESPASYAALRASVPDGRQIQVRDAVIERDAFRFELASGTLHLLAPIEGKTPGAVFIGQGRFVLTPASESERRLLGVYRGDVKLTALRDEFESLVLLGWDSVAALEKDAASAAADPRAADIWARHMKRQKKDLTTNFHLRLLQDLLNGGGSAFLAFFDGKSLPPAVATVDPLGAEAARLAGREMGGEETQFFVQDQERGGLWYSSRTTAALKSGATPPSVTLLDTQHYEIDTTIASNLEVSGTTEFRFRTSADNVRLIPISILSKLRIEEAAIRSADGSWVPVAFIQESAEEDADAALVLDQPLKKGSEGAMRIRYRGKDVLEAAGDDNYYVGARASWYPNAGTFTDLATYDLTFRIPRKKEIVGVGMPVDDRIEGETRISKWKADAPIRVAGFNYGRFRKLQRKDDPSGITVEVFTNPGTPQVMTDINRYLDAQSSADLAGEGLSSGPSHLKVDTARLAESALVDGMNTARVGTAFFGKLPSQRVAITQQSQWAFGQSWPSLIYLPYIAFLDGTTRMHLGLLTAGDFVDQVGYHEFAHQWWGHLVGPASYRDTWISEGFSEFTSAVAVQATGGWGKYDDFWEKSRRFILETPRAARLRNDEVGPISQGYRLSTWQNGAAYQAMVYSKGAYVLHMLRMLMQDPQSKQPDARFIAMMSDFAKTHASGNATTADFKKAVERHMIPELNGTGDGKMDWFFQQWVHGIEIPKFGHTLALSDSGGGKTRIRGAVSMSEVGKDFRTLVPIYLEFADGMKVRIALMPLMGPSSRDVDFEIALPKAPKRVSINALHDVLAR